MRNKFVPTRSRKQVLRRNGVWICYIRDFDDTIVATVTGETRDEAREKGSEEMKKYTTALKAQIAQVRIPIGIKWQSSWRIDPSKASSWLAAFLFPLKIFLDSAHFGLLQARSCNLVYIFQHRSRASGHLALVGIP